MAWQVCKGVSHGSLPIFAHDVMRRSPPALVTQVDEHTMELYVVTPDGITVTSRVHAAVLVCVKTASILAAVLALGPLKEEDYWSAVSIKRWWMITSKTWTRFGGRDAACCGNMPWHRAAYRATWVLLMISNSC